MRVMLGIAIALPIAAAFCLAYLTLLTLEALRDVAFSHRRVPAVSRQHQEWTAPDRVAP